MGQSTPIGSKTILIVEDEALVRFDLVDFFGHAEWRVFDADNADEAIAIPHTNTTETMNKSMRFVLVTAIIKAALKVIAGTGLAVAALRFTGAWSHVRRLTIS